MTSKSAVAKPVRLISKWFVQPGQEKVVLRAITKLAKDIRAEEPGTLMYVVHTAHDPGPKLQSFPPATPGAIVFYEEYASPAAFDAHVNGRLFKRFVRDYGKKFVPVNGKPFLTCEFVLPFAGFIRS